MMYVYRLKFTNILLLLSLKYISYDVLYLCIGIIFTSHIDIDSHLVR